MKELIKRTILVLTSASLLVLGVGCKNTAEGMGDDIEEAGDEIERRTD
jgi:predicted small secreted protein